MANNKTIIDGLGSSFLGATKELSDTAHAPAHVLLDGTTSPVAISPATSGKQDTINTSITTLTAKLPAALSAGGFLKVSVEASAVTFTVTGADLVTDNAAFADGTTKVRPAGFIFDEVAGTALTENDAGAARMDSKRAQVMVLEDETTRGRRLTITAANALKTDPSGVTAPISVASLPLPAGAANETKQDALAAKFPAALTAGGNLKIANQEALPAGEAHLGQVGGASTNPAFTQFARPGDTTAYAIGDLVANNTSGASVTVLQFTVPRVAAGSALLTGLRLKKSTAVVANASFRVHLYSAAPTVLTGAGNGDNAVFATVVTGAALHLGAFDVYSMMGHADGAVGYGAPENGSAVRNIKLASGSIVYALIEARGLYAPGNAETFDGNLEVRQD